MRLEDFDNIAEQEDYLHKNITYNKLYCMMFMEFYWCTELNFAINNTILFNIANSFQC